MAAMSEAELRDWIDRLAPRLIALSTGICRDRHRAEEIVQDAFVKLWNRPPDGGEPAFTAWLRRVVTNASINALQRTRRYAALPEHVEDAAGRRRDTVSAEALAREDRARLSAALDRLDPKKRAILLLRGAEGLSYEEIATHLEVPIGTVMSRLSRARIALAETLATMSEEQGGPVFSFEAHREARSERA
jgi:RNA polymerase sigma-70 factor (ECF subfamily)